MLILILDNTLIFNENNSSIPNRCILDIAIDSQNNKWIGSLDVGLFHYDGTTWTVYDSTSAGFIGNVVSSVAVTPGGTVWTAIEHIISGKSCLGRMKTNKWMFYTTANTPLPSAKITALAVESETVCWIGTPHGCIRFSEK